MIVRAPSERPRPPRSSPSPEPRRAMSKPALIRLVAPFVRADAERVPLPSNRSARRRAGRALCQLLIGTASLCLWFGLWQLASTRDWQFFFRFDNIPAPTEVALAAGELLSSPKFVSHVQNSLVRIFAGFSIAAVLAVSLGVLVG